MCRTLLVESENNEKDQGRLRGLTAERHTVRSGIAASTGVEGARQRRNRSTFQCIPTNPVQLGKRQAVEPRSARLEERRVVPARAWMQALPTASLGSAKLRIHGFDDLGLAPAHNRI